MNAISFSSCLYTSDMIASRVVSAASSFNTLTWQQILGKEELSVLLPALGDYFVTKQLKRQQQSTSNTYYYELYNGKMLYMLTQHSLWNRKHHPFLLCACHQGDGIRDSDHKCIFLTPTEQEQKYSSSKCRWTYKSSENIIYNKKRHSDWCDVNNVGVTHFGVEPSLLP